MSKKTIMIIALLLVSVLMVGIFVGCESFSNTKFEMGSTSVSALSNGGSVVYHGDYIYFINGYSGYLDGFKENWFGKVLKGAILRIKKDYKDMSEAEVIVPKSVVSDSDNAGFSIYGDYIYYTSYSSTETKSGTVDTSELWFMRTRLDGQKTAVILKLKDGHKTYYKYTPSGLVYLKDDTLYFKSTSGKLRPKKEGTVIAEKVADVHFPVSTSYDPQAGYDIADYFFYTKASDQSGNYTNELWVSNADGSFKKKLIDQNTFTNDPVGDQKNAFSITVGTSLDEGNALTLLYKKSYYVGTSSSATVDGMYMYKFDSNFNFEPDKEVKLTSSEISSARILGFEEGVLSTSSILTLYKKDSDPVVFADETVTNKINSANVIGVSGGYVYYYTSDDLVYRYKLDGSSNVEYIGTNKIHDDFIAPELIEDGENAYIYYFNSDKGNYMYRLDVGGYDRKEATTEDILFGKMTSDDASKYED